MSFSQASDLMDEGAYTTTNVMLGYASTEPTDDPFSQLGGTPVSPTFPPKSNSHQPNLTKN